LAVGRWWLVVVVDWRGTSHCNKVGAAVLVLVLALVGTVCVGGERFVGGVACRRSRGCGSALIL
jgi:hypothetical protein